MVGVEVAHLAGQLGAALVGLRDQHRDRVRRRAAAEHEQLDEAVERGRVGDVVAQQRADLVDVVAEQRRGQLELARAHPVAVAAQRVDLAVVGEHPVRVGQLPAREGVGGEARVHEREAAHEALVAQVGEVARELRSREHALVDHGAAREAGDREPVELGALHHAADHVELALERVLVGDALARAHEQLADVRRGAAGDPAALARHHRHVAPAEHPLALGLDGPLDQPDGVGAGAVLAREEADRHAVAALLRAARSPPRPGGTRRGAARGCRRRRRCRRRRPRRRGARGARARAARARPPRARRAGPGVPRTRHHRRRARKSGRTGRLWPGWGPLRTRNRPPSQAAGPAASRLVPPRIPRLLRAGARRAGSHYKAGGSGP